MPFRQPSNRRIDIQQNIQHNFIKSDEESSGYSDNKQDQQQQQQQQVQEQNIDQNNQQNNFNSVEIQEYLQHNALFYMNDDQLQDISQLIYNIVGNNQEMLLPQEQTAMALKLFGEAFGLDGPELYQLCIEAGFTQYTDQKEQDNNKSIFHLPKNLGPIIYSIQQISKSLESSTPIYPAVNNFLTQQEFIESQEYSQNSYDAIHEQRNNYLDNFMQFICTDYKSNIYDSEPEQSQRLQFGDSLNKYEKELFKNIIICKQQFEILKQDILDSVNSQLYLNDSRCQEVIKCLLDLMKEEQNLLVRERVARFIFQYIKSSELESIKKQRKSHIDMFEKYQQYSEIYKLWDQKAITKEMEIEKPKFIFSQLLYPTLGIIHLYLSEKALQAMIQNEQYSLLTKNIEKRLQVLDTKGRKFAAVLSPDIKYVKMKDFTKISDGEMIKTVHGWLKAVKQDSVDLIVVGPSQCVLPEKTYRYLHVFALGKQQKQKLQSDPLQSYHLMTERQKVQLVNGNKLIAGTFVNVDVESEKGFGKLSSLYSYNSTYQYNCGNFQSLKHLFYQFDDEMVTKTDNNNCFCQQLRLFLFSSKPESLYIRNESAHYLNNHLVNNEFLQTLYQENRYNNNDAIKHETVQNSHPEFFQVKVDIQTLQYGK